MALIYLKETEKTLVLSPREAYQRAFDFGTDWTEMRMGMLFSLIAASDPDTQVVDETVVVSSTADLCFLGLKNSDNQNVPGTASSLYLGWKNNSSNSHAINGGANSLYGNGTFSCTGVGYNGVTEIPSGGGGSIANILSPGADVEDATGYCGYFAVKFVITNRGLSSQSVGISIATQAVVSGTDYGSAALRTLMNNVGYSVANPIAWNDGAAAYDIPDAFYVRFPFYNNRIRISCMRASRYA